MVSGFFSELPLWLVIVLFVLAGSIVAGVGIRLSKIADLLADITGMGEAIMGGVFLGATTSLSGITVSVTAAVGGLPLLSLSNAIGGIAAQMTMLVIADMSYNKSNLEHAAASVPNIMQGILQIILLGMLLFAMNTPAIAFWSISPITPVMFLVYGYGIYLVNKSVKEPMWRPRMTHQTHTDNIDKSAPTGISGKQLWIKFSLYALLIIVTGWILTQSAEVIVARTQLSEGIVGALFLAVTTSSAELVTTLAAVRQGALTLAVGDILGGNAFDCLFAAVADIFYREGPIYQTATQNIQGLLALTLIMAGILLMGLIARERNGLARIGFESFGVIICYLLGIALLVFGG